MTKRELLAKLRTVRTAERGIQPDPAWVLRTRETLLLEINQLEKTPSIQVDRQLVQSRPWAQRYIPTSFGRILRGPAVSIASIAGIVLTSSIASVSAADQSVPGDWLFPVKLATEQTRLAFTTDKSEKLKLKTEFVGRRVDEIKTIATTEVTKKEERMKEAADLLKRDLDTVSNQLNEVKTEKSTSEVVEAAKLVDQKSDEIVTGLKEVKSTLPQELKTSVTQAEAAVVSTGVKAVGVLIDVKQESGDDSNVSDEELVQSISGKVQGLEASLADANQQYLGATTGTTLSLGTASTTLQKAKTLLQENRLDEVAPQLIQAVNAVAQAESDVAAQTTPSADPATSSSGATSTSDVPPLPTSSTGTTSTVSTASTTSGSGP